MIAAIGAADAAYAAARWGWYVGAFLLLGAGSYAPFLFRTRTGLHATDPAVAAELSRRAARIGVWASLALAGLALLRLYLQTRSLVEPGEPLSRELLDALLASSWGRGWLTQAAMVALAGVAFAAALRESRLGWMVAAAAAGGVGFASGLTGHANTSLAGSAGMLIDAAHVWTGGLWLGGLAVMVFAGYRAIQSLPAAQRPLLLRVLVADFSRRALVLGPLTVALGIWLAVRYLGWGWPFELGSSSYGLALALKLLALAGVAAMGAYNWRVSQRRLARGEADSKLRRASALELWFGVILLGVTAVLVALPFPEEGP